ncbi:MAG TPA: GGDEF domain-containing protein [Chloroflexota bacterium]|nr:GGDEF domain-containing protein [Chloroflexota bacterium]
MEKPGGDRIERRRNPRPSRDRQHDPVVSAFVVAVRLMEAGRASLLVKRNGEPILTIEAAVGIPPAEVPGIRVPMGYGIAGFVAEHGKPLLGALANDTFVSIPVFTTRGVEGVLNMTDRLGGRPYTRDDMGSSKVFAKHIGDVLEYRRESHINVISGLPDRAAFEEALERELNRAERSGAAFTLVFLDMDGLKWVNDHYGHDRGDELIRTVAETITQAIRPYDFAAHLSGDEFALLLADTHDGEISIVERLQQAPVALDGRLEFSVSIGTARYPDDGMTADQLLKSADQRMYEYKRTHPSPYRRPEEDQDS